ncbi:MAG: hypothetical protein L6367_07065 [Cellulomonas sp.]|nr:hypothetical protein [Actinomycetota bacterium]MCG2798285.1 hypothetical protein [Cellulomonas sp.]
MPPRATVASLAIALAVVTPLLAGCTTSAPAQEPTTPALLGSSPEPTEPLLASDDADSRVGELAPGFPTALVPVPDGAQILVSSAQASDGGLLEISLNLRSTLDTAALLEAIRTPLLAAGFTESSGQTTEGLAAQTTFSRADGKELLVAGIRDEGATRTLTIGGRVMAPAAG